MKKENAKSPSKAPRSEEDLWVNVHNDELMVELGIRQPLSVPRDPSVYTKTSHEKKLLKSLRKIHNKRSYFHSVPSRSTPVKARLIIYLKKNNKFPYTTYSMKCYLHEINSILLRYYQVDKKTNTNKCLISKYVYNGKTYSPYERPFWL